jgi:4-hydroxy 2-oxovalerate aldolase
MQNRNNRILICDPSLRDGNHAVKHQLTESQIATYAAAANAAGVPIVEVGHGNGLGASSLQVGLAKIDDRSMLIAAREVLTQSKLGTHVIPGFATIEKDLASAMEVGVDVFRIATHCTEADVSERHIGYVREAGQEVYGVLMMSHMTTKDVLAEEASKMEAYGAEALIVMDSAGAYLPDDVTQRVSALVECLNIPVGFHGHNNLGMAVANSIAAINAGATILDGTARGFGAGAGNTQLEVLVAVLDRLGFQTGIDLYKILDAGDITENEILEKIPSISSLSIVSGLAGVFSGFAVHVKRVALEYDVDPRDIFFELGRRKVVAGQEDIIIEVATMLRDGSAASE